MQNKVFWKILLAVLVVVAGVLYVPKLFGEKKETPYEQVRRHGKSVKRQSGAPVVRVSEYEKRNRDGSVEMVKVEEGETSALLTSGPAERRPEHLLTAVSEDRHVKAHETFLTAQDVTEKEIAINDIVNFKEKSNKEFLLDVLRDTSEDGIIRGKAATGLSYIGAMDAVPYLLQAMDDPDSGELRARSYSAIRKLTGLSMVDFDPYAPAAYRQGKVDTYRGFLSQSP